MRQPEPVVYRVVQSKLDGKWVATAEISWGRTREQSFDTEEEAWAWIANQKRSITAMQREDMNRAIQAKVAREAAEALRTASKFDVGKPAESLPLTWDTFLVYTVTDKQGRVIYVGQTNNLFSRMAQHRNRSKWWPHAHRVTWQEMRTRVGALRLEERLIRTHQPPFNVQGKDLSIPG